MTRICPVKSEAGMTLAEILIISGIMLLVIYIAFSCLIPALKNFDRSQQDAVITSSTHTALYAISRELKYSDCSVITIIPGTYRHTVDGKDYPCYAIAFSSVLGPDGKYLWDGEGSPLWQKTGIFYLQAQEGTLWYQERQIAMATSVPRPQATYAPIQGNRPDRDRLIARNIKSLYFTDSRNVDNITEPGGSYIRIRITAADSRQSHTLESCIMTKISR
ncbi:MAG: hypothetical protein AB2L14_03795 [Candidatus Xenobiia bacterium LiM19]